MTNRPYWEVTKWHGLLGRGLSRARQASQGGHLAAEALGTGDSYRKTQIPNAHGTGTYPVFKTRISEAQFYSLSWSVNTQRQQFLTEFLHLFQQLASKSVTAPCVLPAVLPGSTWDGKSLPSRHHHCVFQGTPYSLDATPRNLCPTHVQMTTSLCICGCLRSS